MVVNKNLFSHSCTGSPLKGHGQFWSVSWTRTPPTRNVSLKDSCAQRCRATDLPWSVPLRLEAQADRQNKTVQQMHHMRRNTNPTLLSALSTAQQITAHTIREARCWVSIPSKTPLHVDGGPKTTQT